jgi:hypothetical protein
MDVTDVRWKQSPIQKVNNALVKCDRSHFFIYRYNLANKFYIAKTGTVFRLVTLCCRKGFPGTELPFIALSLWETQGQLRAAWFTTDLYEQIRS